MPATRALREVGSVDQAVWSLSTAKPGNGVEQLRDGDLETYWQSDGPQPHKINIQFHRKTRVSMVEIYTDFKKDESYTPASVSVRAGTNFHDNHEVHSQELSEPGGWVKLPVAAGNDCGFLRTYFIQIAVLSCHQNGRDTHIRQIRVFSPADPVTRGEQLPTFSTAEFAQHATIR